MLYPWTNKVPEAWGYWEEEVKALWAVLAVSRYEVQVGRDRRILPKPYKIPFRGLT